MILWCVNGYGQSSLTSKTYSFGVVGKGNGFGVAFKKVKQSNKQFNRVYYADFTSFKHVSEAKVVNNKIENRMPFVYGKLNHNGLIRLGYGVAKPLMQSNLANSLTVGFQLNSGLTIGVQRPVYLRVEEVEDNLKTVKIVKYSPQVLTSAESIVGYARNGSGWDELTVTPGVMANLSVNFTWNDYANIAKRLEIGAMLDYFPSGFDVMAFKPNPKLNPSFFVGFMWVINRG